jgi:hypothetical protein
MNIINLVRISRCLRISVSELLHRAGV